MSRPLGKTVLLLALSTLAAAHEHHDEEVDDSVPHGAGIFMHGAVQLTAWLILFPIGAIFGITRSRWHVPLQVATTALVMLGYMLGHHHGGRRYHSTVHMPVASLLAFYLFAQFAIGVFLKLHVYQESALRKYLVRAHGIVGRTFPLVGYVQVVFGVITLMGFCFGDHLGQCIAHYIMGSSFIFYGTVLALMMHYGLAWLRRKNISQDYIDSWFLSAWGLVNAFTEHGFVERFTGGYIGPWSHKDMQHTTLGVVWLCGGVVGIWLGRNGKRNVIPAMLMAITGYAMSGHAQPSMLSTMTHKLWGWLLIGVGLARVVEICFLLKDQPGTEDGSITSWQHIAPMLLCMAGVSFMAAHEEQLEWVESINMDHITYSLIIMSLGFLIYLYINVMMWVWNNSGKNAPPGPEQGMANGGHFSWKTLLNGGIRRVKSPRPDQPPVNGYARVAPDTIEAEQFELTSDGGEDAYWEHERDHV